MSELTFFENLCSYVGFTARSSAALQAVHPVVEPHAVRIVDDFYATVEAHPGARAVVTGGHEQIERLKSTLVRWLDQLLLGPHDESYFQMRARIGRVHVQIELPQAFMFTAMDRIRVRVVEVVRDALHADREALSRTSTALHQIMDIELAIMLETYREDLLAKNRTADRLATIGQFAAGIGHELRNPLAVVESSVFLLKQRLSQLALDDPKLNKHLDKISAEVQRSNKTISDLLELARNRPPRPLPVAVADLVAGAAADAHLPPEIEVTVAAPPDLKIHGDPDQIGLILSNLFSNASQAMGGRGRIQVRGEAGASETRIYVSDDGPGVPADVRPRLFEALFTTKAEGSGLGLALSRKIAEAHGGTLRLEASEGRGAAFLLCIPVGRNEPSA